MCILIRTTSALLRFKDYQFAKYLRKVGAKVPSGVAVCPLQEFRLLEDDHSHGDPVMSIKEVKVGSAEVAGVQDGQEGGHVDNHWDHIFVKKKPQTA